MKEEPPAKPLRLRLGKLRWWVLALILAICARAAWREYDYQNAVREAKAAGLEWTFTDPITLIRQDWHNALKKETWSTHERTLFLQNIPDLARHRDLIHRLRPTRLDACFFKDENLDALKGLTCLKTLAIHGCPALKNVDGLKGLTGLQALSLSDCPALQNVDGLKGLTNLQKLILEDCPALKNVDALKGCTGLQRLSLQECPRLKMWMPSKNSPT